MSIGLRVAGIALWGVFMVAMASWSNTDAALVSAAVGTVVVGFFIGRWWLLLVPTVLGVLLALGSLLADPGDYHEGSPGVWAAYVAAWAAGIAALLALGVAVNRSAARLRPRSRGRNSPD